MADNMMDTGKMTINMEWECTLIKKVNQRKVNGNMGKELEIGLDGILMIL